MLSLPEAGDHDIPASGEGRRGLNGRDEHGTFDNRVAIVTGGAKGIGRHYAEALAAEGARLMIADIADGKEVAEAIARNHGANSVASSITDVSDENAVKALVAQTMERFGKIDILVNNAACSRRSPSRNSPTSTSRCGIASWRSICAAFS